MKRAGFAECVYHVYWLLTFDLARTVSDEMLDLKNNLKYSDIDLPGCLGQHRTFKN